MNDLKATTNYEKAERYKKNYNDWKKEGLYSQGYFIIFNSFIKNNILKQISGNALKLYIFLGSYTDNFTGECWVSIDTIAKYFNRTSRAVSYWIKELEEYNLIRRLQLKPNDSSHTYLQPYSFE
ncbi:helix-turn-helix domain-containing protein [Lachnospiraceae bacterium 50-23]